MLDLVMLILIVVCFAFAGVYARLCDSLIAPLADKPHKNVGL